ncbi:MAG: YceI family protein [Candidatus Dadabacteria bacterium]|nr:MAG: YceI family protein [Candidatus Dadabacteria bacterium]
MRITKGILALVVALFTMSLVGSDESRAEAVSYAIDPDHSQVIFKVKHMGISTVTGRFDLMEGSYTFDDKDISNSSVETTIQTASVNTNKQKRDDHLKSPDFLNVDKYPTITFKSKEIRKDDGDDFTIVGDLTINGVTKQVELDAEYGGKAVDPMGNERTAFTAETKIDRKDFGLTWNKTLDTGGLVVGDDVKIELEVEGIRKKG